MKEIAAFAKATTEETIGRVIAANFRATPHRLSDATYGPSGELVLPTIHLGAAWLDRGTTEEVIRLRIHDIRHGGQGKRELRSASFEVKRVRPSKLVNRHSDERRTLKANQEVRARRSHAPLRAAANSRNEMKVDSVASRPNCKR